MENLKLLYGENTFTNIVQLFNDATHRNKGINWSKELLLQSISFAELLAKDINEGKSVKIELRKLLDSAIDSTLIYYGQILGREDVFK